MIFKRNLEFSNFPNALHLATISNLEHFNLLKSHLLAPQTGIPIEHVNTLLLHSQLEYSVRNAIEAQVKNLKHQKQQVALLNQTQPHKPLSTSYGHAR